MTSSNETTTAAWDDIFGAVEALYDLGWTDGLPVLPPTADKVAEFLAAGGRDGSEIVGELPERRREITAEKVAANAVMAGCKTRIHAGGAGGGRGDAGAALQPGGPLLQHGRGRRAGNRQRANRPGTGHKLAQQPIWPRQPGQLHHRQGRPPHPDERLRRHSRAFTTGALSVIRASSATASRRRKPRHTGHRCTWSGAFPPTRAR